MEDFVRTFSLQQQEQRQTSGLRSDEIEKMEATIPGQAILSRTSPVKGRRGRKLQEEEGSDEDFCVVCF